MVCIVCGPGEEDSHVAVAGILVISCLGVNH